MSLKDQLGVRIGEHALLNHPFYKAWEAGELPQPALRAYASEYGAFIATMPKGWETLNDEETAEEEREHIALWQNFASALNTGINEAELPAVAGLVSKAKDLFANEATALGALYAFEVQQPETAKSKLEGLKAFYNLAASAEPYFEEHSHNEHEAAKLLARIQELPKDEQEFALQACEQMSVALWDALSDIYDTHCKM
jgi:pyrroloquinoline-quinone synthase